MVEVRSHGFFRFLAPVYDIGAKMAMLGRYERLRQQLLGKIEIRKGRRVLDMASGTGYLAEKLGVVDLVCTDISLDMLTRARAKANGDFVLADAHRLPFKAGVFHSAVSSFALHEVSRPGVVLDEMFRILGPGGEIAVMDVVQQTRFSKKILLEIFHTFVEMRTANYVNMAQLKEGFRAADGVNVQLEMFGLVALVWGKKRV
ncbi:MAG: methyltransferase domain-containing protein [ANME-2 cluster archaeon]|nr:methyltransferase domain-containing protein [ANME-2 cluster archaeon]MDF1557009.1 methyltransferase domain-containing protein [ANME-2 cluster archaeon]